MSSGSVLLCFFVGSGLLGFWPVVRFPQLGPQRIGPALLVVLASMVASAPLPAVFSAVQARAGTSSGLMLVVLPSLALMFWATGCFIRCVQGGLAGGSVR